LPIKLDEETASHVWTDISQLAKRFGLSSYDAAYLELAQRHRLPLSSVDRDLHIAAKALNILVLRT
jgi:predicted nucleic acid-binding protein